MVFLPHIVFFTIIISLIIFNGYSAVIYEDGYTVKTVFDGNKHNIFPYSVVPGPGSHELLLLDSSNSVFYSLSLPLSQESLLNKFSGNGVSKYSDGAASSAMFNKPRSFTIDFKGNVYVADRSNHVVRKISDSGVTTIAGDYSKSPGRVDGPGRNATFSTDFELSFVPEICALLILDHGNNVIRQINIKQEDCVYPGSGGLGSAKVWILALVVSCLAGMLTGFAIRPYIIRSTGSIQTPQQQVMDNLPNESGETSTDVLLRHQKRSYSDNSSNSKSDCVLSQKYDDQLKELMNPSGDLGSSNMIHGVLKDEDVGERGNRHGMVDSLMKANMESFDQDASTALGEAFLGVSTVVKRR